MSRIEKAIEKASRQRNESPVIEPVTVLRPAEAPQITQPAVPQGGAIRPQNPLLVTNEAATKGVDEEYRKLKSVIFELTKQGEFRNTLLVTSALPTAGKTLTSVNLALILAEEYDHTVLLVDTDLRKPSVHEYLGLAPEKGLVHCLTEDYPLERALIRTGIGKLVVLPAGGTVADPTELLASNRMRELIAELKARYPDRYVIFDSTPVLPFAEAAGLGALVDGMLLVVRERHTRASHVKESLEMLSAGNLLGIVYNDADHDNKLMDYRFRY